MRSRIVLPMVVALLTVFALGATQAGAGGGGHDRWSGNWKVGSRHAVFGKMHLRLHGDDKTVTGHYEFSGGGKVSGELNQRFGRTFEGKYEQPDPDGEGKVKGKFEFHISRGDDDTFTGESWQTKPSCGIFGCPTHYREGHRL